MSERKYKLYEQLDESIDDGQTEPGATRYDFVYNGDTFADYFKELAKTLNSDQADLTLLGLPGFKAGLSNKAFVSSVVNRSYVSMWFDDVTKQPKRVFLSTVIPGTNGGAVIFETNQVWNKPNMAVAIQRPSAPLSFDTVIKMFKLGVEILDTQKILDLKDDFNEPMSKSEQADTYSLIAAAYDEEELYEEAAKYWKKAASLYPKKSTDYYDSLAEAAWSLGDGKGVQKNYELLYKLEPNDLYLGAYGRFLLGISPLSSEFQDLKRAKDMNLRMAKNMNLSPTFFLLYMNHYMLGEKTEADAVKVKIKNFETSDNFIDLARMYYRLGDTKNAALYRQKAKGLGYIESDSDIEFFALKF